jgi:ribosomal protein S18 acetylase RimI-like enzyme
MTTSVINDILYQVAPPINNDELNRLFSAAWNEHTESDFIAQLRHSLTYICAYQGDRLVGFVNVAWDGGIHAFILDTTVHPDVQRRGIGQQLIRHAAQAAQQHGIAWLHVDYEEHLDGFYRNCGFIHTYAGLMRLR